MQHPVISNAFYKSTHHFNTIIPRHLHKCKRVINMHLHFIQHMPFETPGSILDWCVEKNHTYTITKIYEDTLLPSLDGFDVLVIMGGSMGVYEENTYSWLKAEKAFIKAAINDEKKVLGICLGAQLIAEVLGAKVKPHTLTEIGWWPVQKTTTHQLTDHLPGVFTTFHWHGDTYTLPENTIQLLSTPGCEQQGFIYKNHVAGLQFHMEVKEDLLENMTDHEKAELVKSVFVQTEDEIKSQSRLYISHQKGYMHGLMDAFMHL